MSKSDRQTARGSHWMLTWNNPPTWHQLGLTDPADTREFTAGIYSRTYPFLSSAEAEDPENDMAIMEEFATALDKGWSYDGQLEVGATSGIPHYQFYVNTHSQQRFSALKKVFPQCHIELTVDPKKAESYCKKVSTRASLSKTKSEDNETEKYTTKMFWEDLARIWPDFKDIAEDEMECFDSATRCLIDSDIPCWMLAVQPQVRKAFQLYGTRIMAQYARKDEAKNIYETPGEEQSDRELHEAEPSECSSEGSEESDQEDDGEGSDEDTETASETASECSE